MDARGEQRLRLGAVGQRVHVDHLHLAAPQRLHVARQLHRIPHTGARVHAAASDRRQPLHLARLEVEQVHDGAGHAQQIAQRPERRLGDRHRLGRRDHAPVDLVEDTQPLRRLGQRGLRRLEARDVVGHDERGAPPAERQVVRDDVDVDDATVLVAMLPCRRVVTEAGLRRLGEPGHRLTHAGVLLGWEERRHLHPEKFLARVAVVLDGGGVHLEEGQAGDVVHPHGQRVGVEEEAKARVVGQGHEPIVARRSPRP